MKKAGGQMTFQCSDGQSRTQAQCELQLHTWNDSTQTCSNGQVYQYIPEQILGRTAKKNAKMDS